MSKKRERIGHMVRYQVDFWVPDSNPTKACVSCQHWLDRLPAPVGYAEAEERGWTRKRVREVLSKPERGELV